MAGCIPVGIIKCYNGTNNPNSAIAIGTLSYFPCSLIDGIDPNSGHIGQTVRMDNSFSDVASDAWTVYSIDPDTAFPNVASTTPLTTNAHIQLLGCH